MGNFKAKLLQTVYSRASCQDNFKAFSTPTRNLEAGFSINANRHEIKQNFRQNYRYEDRFLRLVMENENSVCAKRHNTTSEKKL